MSRKRSHVRTAAARTSSSAGQPSPLSRRRRAREASVQRSSRMRFDKFSLGSIQIDGSTYEHDVVIDRGEVSKRKKKPWECRQLVIGTGAHGNLPVMSEVQREAERRKIKLLTLPTIEALKVLEQDPKGTNAILHVTC